MGELYTHKARMDRIDEMSVRELLEYALNFVHEQSVVVYLSHHYINDVVQAFSGDKLYLVDQTTPTQERIDAAVKRVQKSTPSAKVAIAPEGGEHKRGGRDEGDKKKWKGNLQQQQQRQHQQQLPEFLPGFGGGFGQGGKPRGVLGGGAGPICFTCGLHGYTAAKLSQEVKHLSQLMGDVHRSKSTSSTWNVVILSDVANDPLPGDV